jgi:uncharacterized protein
MAVIPGKSCGACNLCCQVLDIEELSKKAGKLCPNCVTGAGCGIYMTRPQVCRDFECEWLTERAIPPTLKPDRTGTLFMISADTEQYQAVCDPTRPQAWRNPLVLKFLIAKAKEGHVVVAKSGLMSWRVYPSGECAPWT